jgi:hypothetical protein
MVGAMVTDGIARLFARRCVPPAEGTQHTPLLPPPPPLWRCDERRQYRISKRYGDRRNRGGFAAGRMLRAGASRMASEALRFEAGGVGFFSGIPGGNLSPWPCVEVILVLWFSSESVS